MRIEYKTRHGKQLPIKYEIEWDDLDVYSTKDKRVKLLFQMEGEPNVIVHLSNEAANQLIDGLTVAVLDNLEGEETEYTPEEE